MISNRSKLATSALALIMAVMLIAAAPGTAVASTDANYSDDYQVGDYDEADTAPNPYFNISTVTVSEHPMVEGSSDEAMTGYEDDNGDWIAGSETGLEVNDSFDEEDGTGINPFTFNPAHVQESSYGAFPDKDGRTWLNSSGWNINSGSANVTVANTTVATGVDAVNFDATGVTGAADGDSIYEVSYSRWDSELDSDEDKYVFQIATDVSTLETNAEVQIRLYDESGDYKHFEINDSRSFENNNTVVNNATDTAVHQVKLNSVATVGGGSWDNIENVTIRVEAAGGASADSDVSISWLDLRKKTKTDLGEVRVKDSDGDYTEFNQTHNTTGTLSVDSMESLDSEFDDATIVDLKFPGRWDSSDLDQRGEDGDHVIYWDDPQNPSFNSTMNASYRMELPSVIDLSFSGVELRMTQNRPESRYLTLDLASGVSDSTNLSEASGSDLSGNLSAKGSTVDLKTSGISAGTAYVLHIEQEVSDDERFNDIEVSDAPSGAVGVSDDGGPIDAGLTLILGTITAIGVAFRKRIGSLLGLGG